MTIAYNLTLDSVAVVTIAVPFLIVELQLPILNLTGAA